MDSWKPEGIEARLCGDLILYMFLSELKTEIMLSALVFEHCKTATVYYTRTGCFLYAGAVSELRIVFKIL